MIFEKYLTDRKIIVEQEIVKQSLNINICETILKYLTMWTFSQSEKTTQLNIFTGFKMS